jgi:hypothetical protein
MIEYTPKNRHNPKIADDKSSAWGDIPTIIKDIIDEFKIDTKKCIEFGVEFGYSTSTFANYFDEVIGIDTFIGDEHAKYKGYHYHETSERLSSYPNIKLVESDYKEFINTYQVESVFDMSHVDIIHTYEDTYKCGEWCIKNSKITLFHDTVSFDDVKRACEDLSSLYGCEFYNYPHSHGLGILVNKNLF